jgi:hypothetical protein
MKGSIDVVSRDSAARRREWISPKCAISGFMSRRTCATEMNFRHLGLPFSDLSPLKTDVALLDQAINTHATESWLSLSREM